jgi:Mg-chelatase subunit ChlI
VRNVGDRDLKRPHSVKDNRRELLETTGRTEPDAAEVRSIANFCQLHRMRSKAA